MRAVCFADPYQVCYVRRVEVLRGWVVLRGLSREKRQWGSFPELLEQSRPSMKVLRLDLPGIASARDRMAPFSVKKMVDDLRARLMTEERVLDPSFSGRWGVLGVSLGGMVALDWSYRYPHDFGAAVVVNSSAGNLTLPQLRLRPKNIPTLIKAARTPDLVERELIVLRMNTTHHGENREIAKRWAHYRQQAPVARSTLLRQLIAGFRFQCPPSVRTPTLLVSGAKDRFVSPLCTKRLAERLSVPHVQHPTAGHDLPLDAPEWLVKQMLEFEVTHMNPSLGHQASPPIESVRRENPSC